MQSSVGLAIMSQNCIPLVQKARGPVSSYRGTSCIPVVGVLRLIDDLPGHDGWLILILPPSVDIGATQQHRNVVLKCLHAIRAFR